MRIPQFEEEVLKKAYCNLHEAIHNIQCLFLFLKKEYPDRATIEYTVFLHGLLRMQEVEAIMKVELNYPVFGKEIGMGDKDKLYTLLRNILGVSLYGYLDCDGSLNLPHCINNNLHLYEVEF